MKAASRFLLLAIAGAASSASAQQVVLFDEHWVHESSTRDSHYNVPLYGETPADFTSPIDYASGTLHLYMEILDKPTDEPTHMVFCWGTTPTYSCAGQSPRFDDEGRVEWSTDVQRFWRPGGQSLDFSQGLRGSMSAIVKDTMNGKPTADNVGEERAARYFPLEIRMVATLVAPGAAYEAPMPFGAVEPEPDAGVGEFDAGPPNAGVLDAGTDAASEAGVDAGEADARVAGEADARIPSHDAGIVDAGMSAVPEVPERGTLEGSCAASPNGPVSSLALLLFLGCRRSRRRES
ncbi:MAG: hypothetical protein AAF411_02950 [Myxococcota bacterium]